MSDLLPDDKTFSHRARSFFEVAVDPRVYFSTYGQLEKSIRVLENYRPGNSSFEEAKMAKKRLTTSLNPILYEYSKEGNPTNALKEAVIPWAFRFSSFVPTNTAIAYTLLFNPRTPLSFIHPVFQTETSKILFWNVSNRLYNTALDYCNRNPSAQIESSYQRRVLQGEKVASDKYSKLKYYEEDKLRYSWEYLKSFTGATISASAMAMIGSKVASQITDRSKLPSASFSKYLAPLFSRYLSPAFALSSAHVFDLVVIRQSEWREGITIKDMNGNDLKDENGETLKSREAGKLAIRQVGTQRILTANIVLFLPSAVLAALERYPTYIKQPRGVKLGIQLGLCVLALAGAVPLTQAIYPNWAHIESNKLEPQFHKFKGPNNEPQLLQFFRGL